MSDNKVPVDLYSVEVHLHNAQGNLIMIYYPLASVIEVKRNKIWSQITLAGIMRAGTNAIMESKGKKKHVVSLPKEVVLPEQDDAKLVDEK